MRGNEITATIVVGKILRFNGELAGKEESLHSWVRRFKPQTGRTTTGQLVANSSLFQLSFNPGA